MKITIECEIGEFADFVSQVKDLQRISSENPKEVAKHVKEELKNLFDRFDGEK